MSIKLHEEDFLPENLNNLMEKLDELTDYQLDVLDKMVYAISVDREYRGKDKYIMTATMRKLQ
jgi:hypothetical protein